MKIWGSNFVGHSAYSAVNYVYHSNKKFKFHAFVLQFHNYLFNILFKINMTDLS